MKDELMCIHMYTITVYVCMYIYIHTYVEILIVVSNYSHR